MALISHEELQERTGLTQKSAMRRALRKAGIPFREVAGRLWTTEEAITATLVGHNKSRKGPNFNALAQTRQD